MRPFNMNVSYMSKLWHVNEASKIFEIRAFIVELPEAVVLTAVTFLERFQGIDIVRSYATKSGEGSRIVGRMCTSVHGTHHARDKPIDTPTLLHQRYKGRDATFIIGRVPEMRKHHLLERLDLVL